MSQMILQHDILSENDIKGPAFNYDRVGWEIKQLAVLRCNELFSVGKWERPCIVDLLEPYRGRFELHVCICSQSQQFFCVEFAYSQWQHSEVPQTKALQWSGHGSAHVTPQTHGVVWITITTKRGSNISQKEPHSHPGAPALMSLLMGGRWDRMKDKGLTLMPPLGIYSTCEKDPAVSSPASVLQQQRAI